MMEIIWVTSAEHIENYTIRIVFNDGKVKTVDLGDHLDKPVFQPLRDKEFFRNFRINPFTIEWENGADFAPEFLYAIGT
jgi:hypothetical protein